MGPTELKMQPTIPRYIPKKRQILKFFFWKCIVGCIFNSVGLIFTCEIPV
jgi:hypothetical protein